MYVCIYMCIYVCVCVYIYVYICILIRLFSNRNSVVLCMFWLSKQILDERTKKILKIAALERRSFSVCVCPTFSLSFRAWSTINCPLFIHLIAFTRQVSP